jgi:hypothetical protein
MSIHFTDRDTLQRSVAEITETEGPGRPFLLHATQVEIIATPKKLGYLFCDDYIASAGTSDLPSCSMPIQVFVPHAAGPFLEGWMDHWRLPKIRLPVDEMQPSYYAEKDWEPLVTLISSLEKMTELHYAAHNMFSEMFS